MRILVSGAGGFIGSRLCEALKDHEVLRVDRKLGSTIENTDFKDVDLIIHLAAQADVQYSIQHPMHDAQDNIIETIRLIQKYPGVRIIYPASAASLEITSPYGLSKRVAAEYIKLLCKDYIILTLPNIWGPGGRSAVDKFKRDEVLKINGDGHQTRTIVHVDDIVKGFVKAIDWPKGEYSLGGNVWSIKEIAEKIAKDMDKEIVYNPAWKGEVFAATLPNDTPNWKPEIEL